MDKKRKPRPRRARRPAKFIIPEGSTLDYKNVAFLQKFVTDRGKIVSRRVTGANAKQQRILSIAIKRAQFLGLLTTGSVRRP
jgi:small subunit ribosomal protein S18